jgi:hypothetical protein
MPINTKFLNTFRSSVDQSKAMTLARSELEFTDARIAHAWCVISKLDSEAVEIISSVDEIIVRCWNLLELAEDMQERNDIEIVRCREG